MDIAAHIEIAFDIDPQRITGAREVFEYAIDDVFVKYLHLSKRVDVELERFQLHASFVGRVIDFDRREIREIRKRADGREFGTGERNDYLFALVLVLERVERIQIHFFRGSFFNHQSRIRSVHNVSSERSLESRVWSPLYGVVTCSSFCQGVASDERTDSSEQVQQAGSLLVPRFFYFPCGNRLADGSIGRLLSKKMPGVRGQMFVEAASLLLSGY